MIKFQMVLMVLSVLSTSASADEYWICKYPDSGAAGVPSPLTRYHLHEGFLTATSDAPPWTYHVLINNDLAVVAASGEGIKQDTNPEIPYPVILTETVAMNRKTGEVVVGAVGLYGDKNIPVHGICKKQTDTNSEQHD